jgi:hypothetical protein
MALLIGTKPTLLHIAAAIESVCQRRRRARRKCFPEMMRQIALLVPAKRKAPGWELEM